MSAIIVTRGDVDLDPIWASVPDEWEKITWDNSGRLEIVSPVRPGYLRTGPPTDLSVYGRYAAIQHAFHECIYVQDDDCIVENPGSIVACWQFTANAQKLMDPNRRPGDFLVANMPPEFRPHYDDSCLVGFGSCFHRDLPARAFKRFREGLDGEGLRSLGSEEEWVPRVRRTCDVVFTTLTPRVLVDVPVEVLPYAHDDNRMWKQPDHYGERTQVLEMARKVRDAGQH